MTRRNFVRTAAVAAAGASAAEAPLVIPIQRTLDSRAAFTPAQLHRFYSKIWPEAVRDFARCGIRLQCADGKGEIRRSPGDNPIFIGLKRGVINVVLTDHVPMNWDAGRALPGVTTLREGHYLCVIALRYAHANQVPFLSVNTCVHEILHVLLRDIFVSRPKWFQVDEREARIDWYATRLWLFGDGAEVRESAQACLNSLRSMGQALSPVS